jgi:hypothetical protein
VAPVIRGLGAVQPHVKKAAEEVASRFGITNIGGFATSGHTANSDHYTGLAIDVMTSEKGELVSQWAIANAARLGIKYIIWNRRIWQNGAWSKYSGSSPHTNHVHISFLAKGGDGSAPVDNGTDSSQSETQLRSELSGCLGALFGIKL